MTFAIAVNIIIKFYKIIFYLIFIKSDCGASVHQNQGCKDQLVLECVKSKHSSKFATKSSSNISTISNNSSINKRGSTTSLPLPASSGSGR